MTPPVEVSVVVATRDRPERLDALLRSLAAQTMAKHSFEVIVVDDGSCGTATARVLERHAASEALDLRWIRRERPGGPGAARNDGWRLARAALVAFTDDDCVAAPDWLTAGTSEAARHPGCIVQGRTQADPCELPHRGPFSRVLEIDTLGPYYQTCNIFYPRELLERLGGLDPGPRVGEDADLAWRAFEQGARAMFAGEARVFHAVNQLGPVGRLRMASRWPDSVAVFKRHPGLRSRVYTKRIFWKATHYLLVRSLLALAVPRRHRLLRRWLAWPYVRHLFTERWVEEGTSPALVPYHALVDVVELAAVIRAAARYRTLAL